MRMFVNQEIVIIETKKEHVKKKTLIVGDSIEKHIDGWCLNKRMRSTVLSDQFPARHQKIRFTM